MGFGIWALGFCRCSFGHHPPSCTWQFLQRRLPWIARSTGDPSDSIPSSTRQSACFVDRVRRIHGLARDGFSLIEVLVASLILTVGLVSLAQLLALAVEANAAAGRVTYAAAIAAQKMEELRAQPWQALQQHSGESVDYLDRAGRMARGPSGTAAFTRRWSIEPLPAGAGHTLVIQVIVNGHREEARLVSVRTRTDP
jgi:prepilin-type N-terminal cleavage/methylation domain-containing protein